MTTDHEIRNRLRQLPTEHEPQRDLWPAIAARIEATALPAKALPTATTRSVQRRHTLFGRELRAGTALALAASVFCVVSAVVVLLAIRAQAPIDSGAAKVSANTGQAQHPVVRSVSQPEAADHEHDQQLAAAVVTVDRAQQQLQQAIDSNPNAAFLVGLLNQTTAQRMKLARLGILSG